MKRRKNVLEMCQMTFPGFFYDQEKYWALILKLLFSQDIYIDKIKRGEGIIYGIKANVEFKLI